MSPAWVRPHVSVHGLIPGLEEPVEVGLVPGSVACGYVEHRLEATEHCACARWSYGGQRHLVTNRAVETVDREGGGGDCLHRGGELLKRRADELRADRKTACRRV